MYRRPQFLCTVLHPHALLHGTEATFAHKHVSLASVPELTITLPQK